MPNAAAPGPVAKARPGATAHPEEGNRPPCLLAYKRGGPSTRGQGGVKRWKRLTRDRSMPSRIIWNCPALSCRLVVSAGGSGNGERVGLQPGADQGEQA